MNEVDLTVFKNVHNPITIADLHKKIKKEKLSIAKKTFYTAIYRLEKKGFIVRKRQGKNILIQQSSQPVSTYLHTLSDSQPRLIKENIFTTTTLDILLSILHKKLPIQWITEVNDISQRNTRRYLTRLHKAAVITKHKTKEKNQASSWTINKINSELIQFLESYEEFKALKIIDSVDTNANLVWLQGIEFLIKTSQRIHHPNFKETGAAALGKYGLKLLPAENIYFYTKRTLTLWDHAFLTVLSRKHDPTQLRYLAYLYKKHKPDQEEFKQKGNYYDPQTMQLILDFFIYHKETAHLKIQDIKELEKLYGL